MKSKLLLLIVVLLVAGCAGNLRKDGHVVYAQAQVVCDTPVGVDVLQMEAVQFHAVRGQKTSGGPVVNWIGLTPEGYEALTRNIQRILIQTKQSAAVIQYYEACIKAANNAVTTASGQVSDSVKEKVQEGPVAAPAPKAKDDEPPSDLEDENSKQFWQFWKKNA